MNYLSSVLAGLCFCLWVSGLRGFTAEVSGREYQLPGLCDASAAVALSSSLLAVADDEQNRINTYDLATSRITQTLLLKDFLSVNGKDPEADLEAAARLGNRIYWITSHGRNAKGEVKKSRQALFATDVGEEMKLVPAGRPYRALLEDLVRHIPLREFDLQAAAAKAPKALSGLNIEGLAAMPSGGLLIGFRNPIPGGRALVVPLLNPEDTISGGVARLGEPIRLDLAGQGIRSLEWTGSEYLIVAGAFDGGGRSHLFRWAAGSEAPRPLDTLDVGAFNPEAIALLPGDGRRELLLTSDDGTREVDGRPCKKLKDPLRKSFRVVVYPLGS